jgi:hypothetical protein
MEGMMSEIKLLPCPYCGSDEISSGEILGAVESAKNVFFRQTVCINCNAAGPSVLSAKPTDTESDDAWNMRALSQDIEAQIANYVEDIQSLTAQLKDAVETAKRLAVEKAEIRQSYAALLRRVNDER